MLECLGKKEEHARKKFLRDPITSNRNTYSKNQSSAKYRMRRFSCEKKPPKLKRLSIRGTRQRTTSFRLNLSRNADHTRRLIEQGNHSLPSTSETNTQPVEPSSSLPSTSETNTQPVEPSSVFEGKPVSTGKYLERKQKLSEAWASIRTKFLEVRTEEFSPATYICQKCGQQEDEIIRCVDCSSVLANL